MWRHAHQSFRRYRFRRNAPSLAFAMATFVSIRPVVAVMEAAKKNHHGDATTACHDYGCPLLPQDIYYDPEAKEALGYLRTLKRSQVSDNNNHNSNDTISSLQTLKSSGNKEMATLTLIGYKGGPLESQINQDRAFCVSPYHIVKNNAKSKTTTTTKMEENNNRLLGVFDGHADLGELVSQYTVSELPKLLASKIRAIREQQQQQQQQRNIDGQEEEYTQKVTEALVETFVELDQSAPAEKSGGCTASVILQEGQKLYFANAGDSRSFLVVYRAKSKTIEVVYITREDKPHLPDERARVESMGGQVYIPMMAGGTSRVLYTDPQTGMQSGLAMSRSIGDWEVGKLGVIPNPLVEVIDIPELVGKQLASSSSSEDGAAAATTTSDSEQCLSSDDVHIFAVSATDGMMDFATPETIAQAIAISLYMDDGQHLLSALEQLIYMAAQGWEQAKQGRYRDDIAIAVAQIRIPPPPPSQ